jgi:NADPH:quinone reductase
MSYRAVTEQRTFNGTAGEAFGGGQSMRVMVIEPTANGTALTLADIPEPALGPAQIRIGVRAASVNRADLAQRAGAYGPAPGTAVAPVVAGLDAAGEVLEIGEGVQASGLAIG